MTYDDILTFKNETWTRLSKMVGPRFGHAVTTVTVASHGHTSSFSYPPSSSPSTSTVATSTVSTLHRKKVSKIAMSAPLNVA